MSQELAVLEPGGATRQLTLDRERLRVGRSSDNDLSFPSDMSLSRHHLVLEQASDGWYVEDLGAKNRTTINGRRVEGKTRLAPGDRIGAGQLVRDTSPLVALPNKVFMAFGGRESDNETGTRKMLELLRLVESNFKAAGYDDTNFRFVFDPQARHSEPDWAQRLPDAMKFLFGDWKAPTK